MTTIKILLLSTAAVVGIGGTSAALTKDKWWPKSEEDKPEVAKEEDDADESASNCQKETPGCPENKVSEQVPKDIAGGVA